MNRWISMRFIPINIVVFVFCNHLLVDKPFACNHLLVDKSGKVSIYIYI